MNFEPQLVTETSIHPKTDVGYVHLTVANLDQQIAFYQNVLGFKVLSREGAVAKLGTDGGELVRLTEVPGARPAERTTGLYHFALLIPTRLELAHLLRQIAETRTPIQGMVDHHTHLAIYLSDAEGNGIELAWDHPREQWPTMEQMMAMGNARLDHEALFDEIRRNPTPWKGLHAGTKMGHIHLHTNSLAQAEAFYHGILGFDVQIYKPEYGMLFVSAGGYHHHIGLNIWNGEGAPFPPPDATGLRYYTILLPDNAEFARVTERLAAAGIAIEQTPDGLFLRDPAHNGIVLVNTSASA